MRRSVMLATSCAAALALAAAPARAQTADTGAEAEARTHFERGLVLYNRGDYGGALAEFQAAYEQSRRPSVLFNLGLAQQQLHHYPEAARALEQYLREATLTPERRAQVEAAQREMESYIAHVSVVGLPDGAVVILDGARVGVAPPTQAIPVGTGSHTLEVNAPGYLDARETFLVAGGQMREVRFAMRPLSSQRATSEVAVTASLPPIHGALRVQGAAPGARVSVDGRPVRASDAVEVAPGVHMVRVESAGSAPRLASTR